MKSFAIILLACLCSKLSGAVIFTAIPDAFIYSTGTDAFYHVDFNSDGVNDLTFRSSGSTEGIQALPEGTNRVFGTVQNLPDFSSRALRLDGGNPVGPSILANPAFALIGTTTISVGTFSLSFGPLLLASATFDSEVAYAGYFLPFQPGYLGVEFDIGGQIHYGYVLAEGNGVNGAILKGFAYETQPGVPIIAGAVPEPSALALLMPGTLLLLVRRRRGQ